MLLSTDFRGHVTSDFESGYSDKVKLSLSWVVMQVWTDFEGQGNITMNSW